MTNLTEQIFEQEIKAPKAQVYHAFINATALRGWCCEIATVDPKPGGRLYLAWNSGYYSAGEYINLNEADSVTFTWHGRGEPAATQVQVFLTGSEELTHLKLTHAGFGEGPEWDESKIQIEKGWKNGLENLASVLETGEDLRFVLRPMLGITINDYNESIAEQIGVPVTKGIRVDETLEGMGARLAGLQKNDVIVGMNEQLIDDFGSLNTALAGLRAGDTTNVVIYRGAEKISLDMELSKRPIPEIPASPVDLSLAIEKQYLESEKHLSEFLDTISEDEASFKINPDEWSINEILAHLIQGERFYQMYVVELVESQERWSDDYGGNLEGYIQATVESYGSLEGLREEFRRCRNETILLFSKLPPDLVKQKGIYWRLAYGALEGAFHDFAHLDQMRKSVEIARTK